MQHLQGRTVLPFGEFNKLSRGSCYLGRQTPFRATITVCHVFPSGSLSNGASLDKSAWQIFFFFTSRVTYNLLSINEWNFRILLVSISVLFSVFLSFPLVFLFLLIYIFHRDVSEWRLVCVFYTNYVFTIQIYFILCNKFPDTS